MSNASKPSLPENFAEQVVDDMKIRALETGMNLSELLKISLRRTEDIALQPKDFDPDC